MFISLPDDVPAAAEDIGVNGVRVKIGVFHQYIGKKESDRVEFRVIKQLRELKIGKLLFNSYKINVKNADPADNLFGVMLFLNQFLCKQSENINQLLRQYRDSSLRFGSGGARSNQ